MSVAFKELRVYVRSVFVLVVIVAVGLVLFKNRNHEVSFWFLWLTDDAKPVNVVWLILCSGVGTLVTWRAFSRALGLWRDIREVKRLRAVDKVTSRLDKRTTELDERERRIDEKLQSAIADDEQTGDL